MTTLLHYSDFLIMPSYVVAEMRNQPPRPYRVTFTHRVFTVMARTHPEAIRSAQELAGPGARLLSCLQEGEW